MDFFFLTVNYSDLSNKLVEMKNIGKYYKRVGWNEHVGCEIAENQINMLVGKFFESFKIGIKCLYLRTSTSETLWLNRSSDMSFKKSNVCFLM